MKKKKASAKKYVVKGTVTRHLEKQAGREFTEAELIDPLDEELQDAWNKLRSFCSDLGPQRIYASAKAIMFARKLCYVYVRPKKKYFEVWIFLPRKIDGLKYMLGPSQKKKYTNMFKLVHADQVEEPLTDWLREAWDFAPA